jgi:hypothetical protein
MTRPQIRALIEDGPRAGESVVLDVDAADSPPHEIMLPDGHLGVRMHGGPVDRPTHAVSRYRLIGPGDESNFRYRVVPHEE